MSKKTVKKSKNNTMNTSLKTKTYKRTETTEKQKEPIKQPKINPGNKWLYALSFTVPFIVTIIGLIMGGFAPFGSKDIMTAGGHEYMIPFYHELYERAHNGTILAYNYNNAYDFSKVFCYYLSDPLNLIMLILPESAMFACMSILYAVKIGLAGLFSSIFFKYRYAISLFNKVEMEDLRAEEIADYEERLKIKREAARKKNKDKKDFKIGGTEAPRSKFGTFLSKLDIYPFVLSLAYALSSYMITDGANIALTGAVALFPLVLLGIEKLLNEKHWLTYVIAFTLTIYANIYIAMIEFIFMLIYVPTRDFNSLHEGVEVVLKKLLLDLLSIGAGFFIILNSFSSSVFKGDFTLNFPDYNPMANIGDTFTQMMYGNTPSTLNNFINGADLYMGILPLFLLILYFLNGNIKAVSKLKNLIIITVLFLGTVFPTANHFLNAFRNTEFFYCTFGFVFTLFSLTLVQDEIININHTKAWNVLLAFTVLIGVSIYAMIFSTSYDGPNAYLYTMEFAFLYFIIMLVWKENSMTRLCFDILICLVTVLELCSFFPKSISKVGVESKTYDKTETAQYEAAEKYVLSNYEDSTNSRILFYKENHTDIEPVAEMILGIKYVISSAPASSMDFNLEKVDSYNGMNIYKNKYCIEGPIYVPEEMVNTLQEYSYYPFESINEFVSIVINSNDNNLIYQPIPLQKDKIVTSFVDMYRPDGSVYAKEKLYTYSLGNQIEGDIYGMTSHVNHKKNAVKSIYSNIKQQLSIKETGNNIRSNYIFKYYTINKEIYELLFTTLKSSNKKNDSGYILYNSPDSCWRGISTHEKSLVIWKQEYSLFPSKESNPARPGYSNIFFLLGVIISVLSLTILIIAHKLYQNNSIFLLKNTYESLIITISNLIYKYKAYVICIFVSVCLFSIILAVSRTTPFGEKTLLIGDGYLVYYPTIASSYNSLKNGNLSLLNFHAGLFSDNGIGFFSMYMNPLNWPMLFFSEKNAMSGISLIFFIRFLLMGPSIIYYLTHRLKNTLSLSDNRLIPASICYALTNYFVGYFIFYIFFDMALFLPITLVALEKLIYKKDIKSYIISLSICMIINSFHALLLCEFLFLYFFTFKYDSIKDFFLKGLRFGLSSVLSAIISAASLLPLYLITRLSAYTNSVSESSSYKAVPDMNLGNTFIQSFKDLMVFAKTNLVTDDFSKANTYAGILLLFFLVFFIFNKKYTKYERISKILLVVFLYFAYGNEFLNFIFHGFHVQAKVPNRFAIFVVFTVITIFIDSFYSYLELTKTKGIIITIIATSFLLAISIYVKANDMYGEVSSLSMISSILFIIMYCALLVYSILKHHSLKTRANQLNPAILLCGLLFTELLITNIYNIPTTYGTVVPSYQITNTYIMNQASRTNQHTEILRSEYYGDGKTLELFNNSYETNTYGISYFASTITSSHINAFKRLIIPRSSNTIFFGNGNPIANTFLNVKYQYDDAYTYTGDVPSYMKPVSSDRSVTMYESPYNISIGFNIPSNKSINAINQDNYKSTSEYMNIISNKLVGNNIFDMYHIPSQNEAFTNTSENFSEIYWTTNQVNNNDTEKELSVNDIYEILDYEKPYNYTIDHNTKILRKTTSNNTYITLHIPRGVKGDIYIGSSKMLRFIASSDGTKEKTVKLPFFYYIPAGKTELEAITEQMELYKISVLNEETFKEIHDRLLPGCLTNISHDFNTINGDINIEEPGTIYFSLPNVPGFTAYIDGKKADIVTYFGALGVPVSETGKHHIELRYMTPGLIPGIVISIAGIIIFIIVLQVRKKTRRNNKNESGDKTSDSDEANSSNNNSANSSDDDAANSSDDDAADSSDDDAADSSDNEKNDSSGLTN